MAPYDNCADTRDNGEQGSAQTATGPPGFPSADRDIVGPPPLTVAFQSRAPTSPTDPDRPASSTIADAVHCWLFEGDRDVAIPSPPDVDPVLVRSVRKYVDTTERIVDQTQGQGSIPRETQQGQLDWVLGETSSSVKC